MQGTQQAQIPAAGTLNLDHIAHFVPDHDAAAAALENLGFTVTPFSPQSHRLTPDGPLVAAGSGNHCVMLRQGYIEFLAPTADTPIAAQLRAAISRYVGPHLIAFGTATPQADHERLARNGFAPLTPVALQRAIGTPNGDATARFTVVRVPPGTMAEGRIQFCAHHTPELLWQQRWLDHPNGAIGLNGVMLCVADPAQAAARYVRFTGLTAGRGNDGSHVIATARGRLTFVDAESIRQRFGIEPPAMPWIVGAAVASDDVARTRKFLADRGVACHASENGGFFVMLPAALGGLMTFEAAQ
jgi:hypothetical protein